MRLARRSAVGRAASGGAVRSRRDNSEQDDGKPSVDLVTVAKRVYSSKLVRKVVPATILLASIVLMVMFAIRESEKLRTDLFSLRLELLAGAVLLAIASNLGSAMFWRTVVIASGTQISVTDTLRIWCLSTPAKYGLGALTQYAGRVYLAARAGADHNAVLASLPLELALIAFSGVVVLLLSAPAGGWLLLPDSHRALVWVGPLLAILAVMYLPGLAQRATRLLPEHWRPETRRPLGRRLRVATLAMIANWLLFAATSFVLLQAMTPSELTLYPVFVFVVTLAILLGLIAVTPLGLGVREVTMTLLLSQIVPAPVAAATAVTHRLVTIVAEVTCAIGVLLVNLVKRSSPLGAVTNAAAVSSMGHHETKCH